MGVRRGRLVAAVGGPGGLVAAAGLSALVVAAALRPSAAGAAASGVWPPFVLVAGLLLIGFVADDDGLFEAGGAVLARIAGDEIVLFVGTVLIVGVVTALLNLDTSVAFLTPVIVYTTRRRKEEDAPLLYGCLLLSNAGSLFLPGSNLTNLIVLGHLHLTGAQFLAHMWAPALAALLVTAGVVALVQARSPRSTVVGPPEMHRARLGWGAFATAAAVLLVLLLKDPAIPVAAVGAFVAGLRCRRREGAARHVFELLGVPVLVGLFGIAVALGTLGRVWSGPYTMLTHLGTWATGAVAAVASVLFNNLPAASLLAARVPPHPFALLVGLNIGPNLFVTGSLAWFLWLRSARAAGATPSIAKASTMGLLSVPFAMAAALGVLVLTGSR